MLADPAVLQRWLEGPSLETFLAVRSLVLGDASYNRHSQVFLRVFPFLKEGRHDKVRDVLMGEMPNLLLSPRAHMMLAVAYRHLGARESEEMEGYLLGLCLQGIGASGDGSVASPYLVTRVEDEYDFLSSRQLERGSQVLLEGGVDRLTAACGTVLHFSFCRT